VLHWREEDQRRLARWASYAERARRENPADAPNQPAVEPDPPPPPQAAASNAPVAAPENPSDSELPTAGPPPIDQILEDISALVRQYLVCSDHQLTVLALWVVHTYCFNYFPVTPYLNIVSPEKQSGKTVCLQLLNVLCNKPWMPGGVACTRMISRIANSQPTLLLDDWNTIFRLSDAQLIIGFLNAGSTDGSRYVTHSGIKDSDSDQSIFCPKAFAGTGCLPASLADRCIPIALQRPRPKESVTAFWLDLVCHDAARLVETLPDWAEKNYLPLRLAACDFLSPSSSSLTMRQRQFIAPLLAIAKVAGVKWLRKARTALLRILNVAPVDLSEGLQLLSDIRSFFASRSDPPKIHSAPLLDYLNDLEDRPWKKQLSFVRLRVILRNFPIGCSRSQRIGKDNCKGFTFKHFVESWQCYLPHLLSERSTQVCANPPQVATSGPQAVTNGSQVGTNDLQVGANSQPGTEIPNVFNACDGLPVNSKSFQPEEPASVLKADSSTSARDMPP
jgi:hypothetical protein